MAGSSPADIGLPEGTDLNDFDFDVVEAFNSGLDEDDEASLSRRLAETQAGPLWRAAVRRDGAMNKTVGSLRGGAVTEYSGKQFSALATEVSEPQ